MESQTEQSRHQFFRSSLGGADLKSQCQPRCVLLRAERVFVYGASVSPHVSPPPRTEGSLCLFAVEDGRKLAHGQDRQSAGAYWKPRKGPGRPCQLRLLWPQKAAPASIAHSAFILLEWSDTQNCFFLFLQESNKSFELSGGKVSWNKHVMKQTCSWTLLRSKPHV